MPDLWEGGSGDFQTFPSHYFQELEVWKLGYYFGNIFGDKFGNLLKISKSQACVQCNKEPTE